MSTSSVHITYGPRYGVVPYIASSADLVNGGFAGSYQSRKSGGFGVQNVQSAGQPLFGAYFYRSPKISASPALPGGPLYVSGGSNISQ